MVIIQNMFIKKAISLTYDFDFVSFALEFVDEDDPKSISVTA